MKIITSPDKEIIRILQKKKLISDIEHFKCEALLGGVSSNIWKIQSQKKTFCLKKALPKLNVAAAWHAPIERNHYEASWNKIANKLSPGSAPKVIFHDQNIMFFVMEYFNPKMYKLWKSELREGRIKTSDSENVAKKLSHIHARAIDDDNTFKHFPRNKIFQKIRLEPYLEATAKKHPSLRHLLIPLSKKIGKSRITMIHGDVSPKNILIGPNGPVFLDAECACMGDPAFDLAFCLNHLLLKCLMRPTYKRKFLSCFTAMKQAYLQNVQWEDSLNLEKRVTKILPALLLARVDGKSPVEYVNSESEKNFVRRVSMKILNKNPISLDAIRDEWKNELKYLG